MRATLLLILWVSTVSCWPPAPSLGSYTLTVCAGPSGAPPEGPITALLTLPAAAPVGPGLSAFLFYSDDGTAWRDYYAALSAGLPAPPVPSPASLGWLAAANATVPFIAGAGVALPGALFNAWAAPGADASWASHVVVYVTALGSDTPPPSATLEEVAARAVAGALASRVSLQAANCTLPLPVSPAAVEQLVNERLNALPPLPTAPTPTASRVPDGGAGSVAINGASAAAASALAGCLAAAALMAAAVL